jgi:ElaB/YqjD/DUF883 family membrane-anchored ribosome-binding protein
MQAKHRNAGAEIAEHAENAAHEIQSAGAAAWDSVQQLQKNAKNGVVTGARAADKVIRQNPYQAIGVAFGVGLLLGFLVKRK